MLRPCAHSCLPKDICGHSCCKQRLMTSSLSQDQKVLPSTTFKQSRAQDDSEKPTKIASQTHPKLLAHPVRVHTTEIKLSPDQLPDPQPPPAIKILKPPSKVAKQFPSPEASSLDQTDHVVLSEALQPTKVAHTPARARMSQIQTRTSGNTGSNEAPTSLILTKKQPIQRRSVQEIEAMLFSKQKHSVQSSQQQQPQQATAAQPAQQQQQPQQLSETQQQKQEHKEQHQSKEQRQQPKEQQSKQQQQVTQLQQTQPRLARHTQPQPSRKTQQKPPPVPKPILHEPFPVYPPLQIQIHKRQLPPPPSIESPTLSRPPSLTNLLQFANSQPPTPRSLQILLPTQILNVSPNAKTFLGGDSLQSSVSSRPQSPLSRSQSPHPQKHVIWTHARRIYAALETHRYILLTGDTGSGKSTYVPQMLCDIKKPGGSKVLCTSPRRVATLSVAQRVANLRRCVLGEEVGYIVGQQHALSSATKITFSTAGMLLKDLSQEGLSKLDKYDYIILDEVHERSAENDLVLSLCRRHDNPKLRLIMMSATVDLEVYRNHFSTSFCHIAVDAVSRDVIPLQTRMLYLTHLADNNPFRDKDDYIQSLVKNKVQHLPEFAVIEREVEVIPSLLELASLLIAQINIMFDPKWAILVFLPGFGSIESLHRLLVQSSLPGILDNLSIRILHGKVNVKQAVSSFCPTNGTDLKGEVAEDPTQRRVFLGTCVAESSITIPDLKFVLDFCLDRRVTFDWGIRQPKPEIVLCSQAQCNQRAGRTGRTCDGFVVRLISSRQWQKLDRFPSPAILRSGLLDETLLLVASASKAVNHASEVFSSCLTPPSAEDQTNAERLLVAVGALARTKKSVRVTELGRLLASLPLAVPEALLVVTGACLGLLREALVLASIISSSHVFEYDLSETSAEHMQWFGAADFRNAGVAGKNQNMLCQLAAFEFWQQHWVEWTDQQPAASDFRRAGGRSELEESYWVQFYSKSSLSSDALWEISDLVDSTFERLLFSRPDFLFRQAWETRFGSTNGVVGGTNGNGENGSFSPRAEVQHAPLLAASPCSLNPALIVWKQVWPDRSAPGLMPVKEYGKDRFHRLKKLLAVYNSVLRTDEVSPPQKGVKKMIKKVKKREPSGEVCRFFLMGNCGSGVKCIFAHTARGHSIPECKYFAAGDCRFGDACVLRHGNIANDEKNMEEVEEEEEEEEEGFPSWLDTTLCAPARTILFDSFVKPASLLLLGEGDFSFCESLVRKGYSASLITATHLWPEPKWRSNYPEGEIRINSLRSQGTRCLFDVDVTEPSTLCGLGGPFDQIVFQFPFAEDDLLHRHRSLLYGTLNLAKNLLTPAGRCQFTLVWGQLTAWRVIEIARNLGFRLHWAQPFDIKQYHCYSPVCGVASLDRPFTFAFVQNSCFVPPLPLGPVSAPIFLPSHVRNQSANKPSGCVILRLDSSSDSFVISSDPQSSAPPQRLQPPEGTEKRVRTKQERKKSQKRPSADSEHTASDLLQPPLLKQESKHRQDLQPTSQSSDVSIQKTDQIPQTVVSQHQNVQLSRSEQQQQEQEKVPRQEKLTRPLLQDGRLPTARRSAESGVSFEPLHQTSKSFQHQESTTQTNRSQSPQVACTRKPPSTSLLGAHSPFDGLSISIPNGGLLPSPVPSPRTQQSILSSVSPIPSPTSSAFLSMREQQLLQSYANQFLAPRTLSKRRS